MKLATHNGHITSLLQLTTDKAEKLSSLNENRRLLHLVKKVVEKTGVFDYPPLIKALSLLYASPAEVSEVKYRQNLVRLALGQIEKTGVFDYPPFIEWLCGEPQIKIEKENLVNAIADIVDGAELLQDLLARIDDQAVPVKTVQPVFVQISKGIAHLDQEIIRLEPYLISPSHYPWPNLKSYSEPQIKTRIRERMKALRYFLEGTKSLIASRKDHQIQRLEDMLGEMVTCSQEVGALLMEGLKKRQQLASSLAVPARYQD